MGLTVYGDPLSPLHCSICVFCKVNSIPYTDKFINLSKGDQKGEAYLKISPFGQVPSIVDDDFILTQCFSILKYLAGKNEVADHWYPAELKARAKVNEYLDWHHTSLRKWVVIIFHEQVLNPKFGKPTDVEKLAKDYENFDETIGIIEKTFLGDGAFLCGRDEISIADICAVLEIMQIVCIQRTDGLANHPKLAAWKDRVIKRLNPAYDEVHQTMVKLAASEASKK